MFVWMRAVIGVVSDVCIDVGIPVVFAGVCAVVGVASDIFDRLRGFFSADVMTLLRVFFLHATFS